MWVLGIFGGLFVVCLCCCGGGAFWAVGRARDLAAKMMTQDPVLVAERTESMVDITIPASLKPKMAMSVVVMNMVIHQTDDARSTLMLAEMPQQFNESDEDFKKRFDAMLEDTKPGGFKYKAKSGRELRVAARTYIVRGEPTSFQFSEVEDEDTGQIRHMYAGTFKGKRNPTVLNIQVDPDQFNEEAVKAIIESIR